MTAPVRHLAPTRQAGHGVIMRGLEGGVVMLNLLRLRPMADHSATPELAPAAPINGAEAFKRGIRHTPPWLRDSGGVAQHAADLAGPGHLTAAIEASRPRPLRDLPLGGAV